MKVKKFLIIQTASIGDVILSTPLIEKIHHFFGDARIDFLLKKGNEKLFAGHPFLTDVLIWDKRDKKYRNLLDLVNYVRDQKYDYVINVQRFASSGFITALSGAKHTVGFTKNPFSLFFSKRIKHRIKADIHETDRNLKLIEHLTGEGAFSMKLYPSQRDFAAVSQFKTRQYLCVAPASLWFTKQYPKDKWIEFIDEREDEQIYLIGGQEDKKLCNEIIEQSRNEKCLNLAGKLSLLQTAALMKDAKMNFTNDSAPMHLASAMNANIAAVFCSTVPEFGFGPKSSGSHVVQTDVELKCKPCGLHGYNECPEGHFKCALTINKKQLANCIE